MGREIGPREPGGQRFREHDAGHARISIQRIDPPLDVVGLHLGRQGEGEGIDAHPFGGSRNASHVDRRRALVLEADDRQAGRGSEALSQGGGALCELGAKLRGKRLTVEDLRGHRSPGSGDPAGHVGQGGCLEVGRFPFEIGQIGGRAQSQRFVLREQRQVDADIQACAAYRGR